MDDSQDLLDENMDCSMNEKYSQDVQLGTSGTAENVNSVNIPHESNQYCTLPASCSKDNRASTNGDSVKTKSYSVLQDHKEGKDKDWNDNESIVFPHAASAWSDTSTNDTSQREHFSQTENLEFSRFDASSNTTNSNCFAGSRAVVNCLNSAATLQVEEGSLETTACSSLGISACSSSCFTNNVTDNQDETLTSLKNTKSRKMISTDTMNSVDGSKSASHIEDNQYKNDMAFSSFTLTGIPELTTNVVSTNHSTSTGDQSQNGSFHINSVREVAAKKDTTDGSVLPVDNYIDEPVDITEHVNELVDSFKESDVNITEHVNESVDSTEDVDQPLNAAEGFNSGNRCSCEGNVTCVGYQRDWSPESGPVLSAIYKVNHKSYCRLSPEYNSNSSQPNTSSNHLALNHLPSNQIKVGAVNKSLCIPLTHSVGKISTHDMSDNSQDSSTFLGILDLPGVLLLNILQYFSISELCWMSTVCRQWYQVVYDSQLWKDLNFRRHKTITDIALVRLTSISPTLFRLNLSECDSITEQGFCTTVSHCQSLQELRLFRSKFLTDICLQSVGCYCHCLKKLDLTLCSQITDEGIQKVGEGCSNLETLILDQCRNLTDHGLIKIAENCNKLLTLSLDMCEKVTDIGLIKITENCPLKKLLLNQSGATAATMLGVARNCPNIEYLDMKYHQSVNDEAVLVLVQSCMFLRALNLSLCNSVTDQSVANILMHCKKLEKLYLIGCNITNTGLQYFSNIGCQLERLDVSWCHQVSDTGVRVLVEGCPTIKHIGLMRCDQVSQETVVELMNHHPHVFLSTFITEMNLMLKREGINGGICEFMNHPQTS